MLRVGSVPYLVARPLDLGLGEEAGIALEHAPPAELVRRLRAEEVDVALVSSIELFRRPGYTYLDGPAVAGFGRVSSVQVFLRRPLAEVRSLALDPASRTAAALVRVVWPGPRPELVAVAPDADPRTAGADAWLRIGDAALREALAPDAPPDFSPSEAWSARTGLPFVFAVWMARPGVELARHAAAFARARARGRARTGELAREAARAWGLPQEPVRAYLEEECLFEPGPRLGPALRAFRDAAAGEGLCLAGIEPLAVGT